MKKLLFILPLLLLLLTSCSNTSSTYVSSNITNKWDRHWVQVIRSGKTTISVPHHNYYFEFNEVKPYTKKVNQGDYSKFEIGDIYTFIISSRDKDYFFKDSIVVVENE